MKRSAAIPVLTLGLVCVAPVGYVLLKPNPNAYSESASTTLGQSILPDPDLEEAPVDENPEESGGEKNLKADPKKAAAASTYDFRSAFDQASGILETAMREVTALTQVPDTRLHEPRLSVYDTAKNCLAQQGDGEICKTAYREARMQSERSSAFFSDLDACEHRYGVRACYERTLRRDLTGGESIYLPIMAGFAMVTDGRTTVSRPVYACPPTIRVAQSCHQTEIGIVMRDGDNNRPMTLASFERDYTGHILRQTVRETEMLNGRAFVRIRTASYESDHRSGVTADGNRLGKTARITGAPRTG